MTTRWIVVTTSSPGIGYFQACSVGCPTFVSTRYISPTPRWSCWKVAIFRESGDHSSTGRSLFVQPALSVAYPKSFTPSLVSRVSAPVATSRTHRLSLRMKAASFPSGEIDSGRAAPRSAALVVVHDAPLVSHVNPRASTANVMLRPSAE